MNLTINRSKSAIKICAYIYLISLFYTQFVVVDGLAEELRIGKHLFIVGCAGIGATFFSIIYLIYHKQTQLSLPVIFPFAIIAILLIKVPIFSSWKDEQFFWWIGAMFIYFFLTHVLELRLVKIQYIAFFLVSSSGIQALIGLLQIYSLDSGYSLNNITGTFFNPALLGGLLAASLPYALVNFRWLSLPKGINGRYVWLITWFNGVVLFLIMIVIPSTFSRAAWLGAIIGCAVVLFSNRAIKYKLNSYFLKIGVYPRLFFIALVFVSLFFLFFIYSINKKSADGRMLAWSVCWEMIKEKPLLGHGFNHLGSDFLKYQSKYFAEGKGSVEEKMLAGDIHWAFNEFVQIMVEQGFVGFSLFISWIMVTLAPLYKKRLSRIERGALGSLLAMLTFSCFSYPFYSPPLFLLFLISMSFLTVNRKRYLSFKFLKVIYWVFLFTLSAIVIFFASRLPQKYWAYWYWDEAKKFYINGEYSKATISFEKAYQTLSNNGKFLLQFGINEFSNQKYKKAQILLEETSCHWSDSEMYVMIGDTYKSLGELDKAEVAYIKGSHVIPHKFYPVYNLALFYIEKGDTLSARERAFELITKPIKIPSITIDKMKNEMYQLINDTEVKEKY